MRCHAWSRVLPVVWVLLIASLSAQGEWRFRPSINVPDKRLGAMAYDSVRQVSVFQTGLGTFEWDGSGWLSRGLISKPFHWNLVGFSMAYDPGRQRMVLYGGHTGSGTNPYVYEWDGSVAGWIIDPATDPPVRSDHAMVYEPTRHRFLVFGGVKRTQNSSGAPDIERSDTWSWNGSNWIDLDPVTSPSPRHGHAMAYDPVTDRVILFGGKSGEETTHADTWAWDGTNWTELFPSVSPPARQEHSMAYDSAQQRIFLFGGESDDMAPLNSAPLNDSWEWDGDSWTPVHPTSRPARRFSAAMDYDSSRQIMVMFGGSNGAVLGDTWEYTPGSSASFTTFGTSCPGTMGIPTLSEPFGGSVPIAGQSFSVQINNLPLDALTWMLLGESKTEYGLLALPYDLAEIGLFGCTLFVSGDFLLPVTSVLGVGLWTVEIPESAAEWTVYNQAVIFDTAGNIFLSDAGEIAIGG